MGDERTPGEVAPTDRAQSAVAAGTGRRQDGLHPPPLADWVAFVAALALLVVMARWYTTTQGAEFRRDSGLAILRRRDPRQGPDLKGATTCAQQARLVLLF